MLFDNFDLLYLIVTDQDLSMQDIAHVAQVNHASATTIQSMWPYVIRKRYPFLRCCNESQLIRACQRFHQRSRDWSQLQPIYKPKELIDHACQDQGNWSKVILRLNLLQVPLLGIDEVFKFIDVTPVAGYVAMYYLRGDVVLTINYFAIHSHSDWRLRSDDHIWDQFFIRQSRAPQAHDSDHLIAELSHFYRFLDKLLFERI
jgi:hypothetical protein